MQNNNVFLKINSNETDFLVCFYMGLSFKLSFLGSLRPDVLFVEYYMLREQKHNSNFEIVTKDFKTTVEAMAVGESDSLRPPALFFQDCFLLC